jgi:hypothetical protein
MGKQFVLNVIKSEGITIKLSIDCLEGMEAIQRRGESQSGTLFVPVNLFYFCNNIFRK